MNSKLKMFTFSKQFTTSMYIVMVQNKIQDSHFTANFVQIINIHVIICYDKIKKFLKVKQSMMDSQRAFV